MSSSDRNTAWCLCPLTPLSFLFPTFGQMMWVLSYHFCRLAMPPLTFPEAILSYDWQERPFLVRWICPLQFIVMVPCLLPFFFPYYLSFSSFENVQSFLVSSLSTKSSNWPINSLKLEQVADREMAHITWMDGTCMPPGCAYDGWHLKTSIHGRISTPPQKSQQCHLLHLETLAVCLAHAVWMLSSLHPVARNLHRLITC